MRKPLLIYLHHDRSILSNIFCSQLLCAESVVNLLSANFISWAWDLTGKQQKEALVLLLAVVYMCVGGGMYARTYCVFSRLSTAMQVSSSLPLLALFYDKKNGKVYELFLILFRLLQMVKSAFGEEIAESVESVKSDNLPVILIVCKMDGKVEVQNIIQGHTDLETLIGHLFTAMDIHTEHQQRDSIEEVGSLVCTQTCTLTRMTHMHAHTHIHAHTHAHAPE